MFKRILKYWAGFIPMKILGEKPMKPQNPLDTMPEIKLFPEKNENGDH